ncbi:MAG TPA: cupin domain-containing protein [Steroidobacteraceae bacterium]
MSTASPTPKALIIAPDRGRHYSMGRMSAIFKADCAETESRYSISEWWLEPKTKGPGTHAHPEDHIFYVIEGNLSLLVNGEWLLAERGTYAIIPGGTPHNFENRGSARCGFMSLNAPGGFELKMPAIVQHLSDNPVGETDA